MEHQKYATLDESKQYNTSCLMFYTSSINPSDRVMHQIHQALDTPKMECHAKRQHDPWNIDDAAAGVGQVEHIGPGAGNHPDGKIQRKEQQ